MMEEPEKEATLTPICGRVSQDSWRVQYGRPYRKLFRLQRVQRRQQVGAITNRHARFFRHFDRLEAVFHHLFVLYLAVR